jgi:hypothetical protein
VAELAEDDVGAAAAAGAGATVLLLLLMDSTVVLEAAGVAGVVGEVALVARLLSVVASFATVSRIPLLHSNAQYDAQSKSDNVLSRLHCSTHCTHVWLGKLLTSDASNGTSADSVRSTTLLTTLLTSFVLMSFAVGVQLATQVPTPDGLLAAFEARHGKKQPDEPVVDSSTGALAPVEAVLGSGLAAGAVVWPDTRQAQAMSSRSSPASCVQRSCLERGE